MKLTTEQAHELIEEIKKYAGEESFNFPDGIKNRSLIFEVVSDTDNKYIINIDRKGIDRRGCTYQGRTKGDNCILMRLDINPSSIHINPSNGSKIQGSHLHIYTEEYDIREAIPFDPENNDLDDLCCRFFEQFHVAKYPNIIYQTEL